MLNFCLRADRQQPLTGRWIAAIACTALVTSASAAPGDLDTAFGLQGQSLVDFGPGVDVARGVGHLPDGRIVIAGTAALVGGAIGSEEACAVAMLLPDGNLDTSFGNAGRVTLDFDPGRANVCNDLVVQPDGRIVLVGHHAPFSLTGNLDFMVIRLNPDGSLDTSFSGDGYQFTNFALVGGSVDQAKAVALQADGKLVVVGRAERGPGDYDLAVVRLNSDGTPDTSFSGDGRTTLGVDLNGPSIDIAEAVAIQSDGRIVLAGTTESGTTTSALVARFTSSGLADGSFNLLGYRKVAFGAIPSSAAYGLVIRGDGNLLIGGLVSNGLSADFAALALLPNGQNDPGFGVGGQVIVDFLPASSSSEGAYAIALDPIGRVVLGGPILIGDNYDFAALRLLPNGSVDAEFGVQGKVIIPFDIVPAIDKSDIPDDLHILPDGGILLVGAATVSASGANMALVKLQSGLESDQIFSSGFEP